MKKNKSFFSVKEYLFAMIAGISLIIVSIIYSIICTINVYSNTNEGIEYVRVAQDNALVREKEIVSITMESSINDGSEIKELLDYGETLEGSADSSTYFIKVNRLKNVVTIYAKDDNGSYTIPVKAMCCSVGVDGNTPVGEFKLSEKCPWMMLEGNVWGQYAYRITGSILFHSVPYYSMNKDDIETEEYNKLGQAASLGCVRLSIDDVKWIYDNIPQWTIVQICDEEDISILGKPSSLIIAEGARYSGWDPTDIDEVNPWEDGMPVIYGASDKTIKLGQQIDLLDNIYATNSAKKDLTDDIQVDGEVDIHKAGEYKVTYSLEYSEDICAKTEIVVTVK